jgi:hypothetical protein
MEEPQNFSAAKLCHSVLSHYQPQASTCYTGDDHRKEMRLSLPQEQAINELSSLLYSFLPGKPHPYADPKLSFGGIAASMGLRQFWAGGSKQPAIAALLRQTFENRSESFCALIVEIVRRGMVYRQNKGEPVTREDIRGINGLLVALGFKIPELHDPKFLDGLPSTQKKQPSTMSPERRKALLEELVKLTSLSPQQRGYAFEAFIKELFASFELAPRDAFRIVGEQIDGSFQLQGETYLVEATWRNERVGEEELLAFSGKISGKAKWSRGLLVSYAGFTVEGLDAFARGKPTAIVCMEGLCLHDTLRNGWNLSTVIERKARRAAETNEAFVRTRELFPAIS